VFPSGLKHNPRLLGCREIYLSVLGGMINLMKNWFTTKVVIFLTFLSLFAFSLLGTASNADASVRVRGYTNRYGTYVQPYYRSNPDGLKSNNYSSWGNYNSYTGKKGYNRW